MKQVRTSVLLLIGMWTVTTSRAQLGPMEITPEWGWAGWSNPAVLHPSGGHIWLGGLAGLQAQLNHTGPAVLDFATEAGAVDPAAFLAALSPSESVDFATTVPLIAFGFREERKFEFRMASRLVAEQQLTYDRDLFTLGWLGNGHPDIIGQELSFSEMGVNAQTYLDHSLSVGAMVKEDKLWLGWGIHILNGIGSIQTGSFDATWKTDSVDYSWDLTGSATFNTAGINLDSLSNGGEAVDLGSGIPPILGSGVAFDFGFLWKLTPEFEFEGAIQGRGGLRWLMSTQQREVPSGAFVLQGLDVVQWLEEQEETGAGLDSLPAALEEWVNALPDSLADAFAVQSLSGPPAAFDTRVAETWRLGFRLRPAEGAEVFAMAYRQFRFSRPSSGFVFGGVCRFRGNMAVHAQGQYTANRWSWGGGVSLRGGPIRLAISAQNVMGVLLPLDAGHLHGQVSMGFELGYRQEKNQRRKRGDLGTGKGMWH